MNSPSEFDRDVNAEEEYESCEDEDRETAGKTYANSVNRRKHDHANMQRSKALVPRERFYKLTFPSDITLREKYRWANKYGTLYAYQLTIPNKEQWWFKHIYVLRTYTSIINDLMQGNIGDVKFVSADEPPRKKSVKYREYLCKGIPPTLDEDILDDQLGKDNIHLARRIYYNGKKSSTIKIVWKPSTPPPSTIPLLGSHDVMITITEMLSGQPRCYNCQAYGHIARNCSNQAICPRLWGAPCLTYLSSEREKRKH